MEKFSQPQKVEFDDFEDIPDENSGDVVLANTRMFVEQQSKNNLVHDKGGIKPQDLLFFMTDLNYKKAKVTNLKKDRANSYGVTCDRVSPNEVELKNLSKINSSVIHKINFKANLSFSLSATRGSSKKFTVLQSKDKHKPKSKFCNMSRKQLESSQKSSSFHIPPVKLVPFDELENKRVCKPNPRKPNQKLFSFGLNQL